METHRRDGAHAITRRTEAGTSPDETLRPAIDPRRGVSDAVLRGLLREPTRDRDRRDRRGDQPRDRAEVRALAKALGLRAEPLEQIAIDKWEPVAQRMELVEPREARADDYRIEFHTADSSGSARIAR